MGGKPSTHVYNSYEHAVFVRCHSEKIVSSEAGFNAAANASAGHDHDINLGKTKDKDQSKFKFESKVQAGVNVSLDARKERRRIEEGFVKICPGGVVRFDVDTKGTKFVYITIYDEHGNLICDNLSKKVDFSIIIDTRGQVVDTKYHELYVPDVEAMQQFVKPPLFFQNRQNF